MKLDWMAGGYGKFKEETLQRVDWRHRTLRLR